MVTRTGVTDPVRLGGVAGRTVRAWVDLDAYELLELPVGTVGGTEGDSATVSGELDPRNPPDPWSPVPAGDQDLVTQIFFGVRGVSDVEESLGRTFRDDLRLAQTGLAQGGPGSGLTCRGMFLLDATGAPVPGSFTYAPLVDLAAGVEHHARSMPRTEAISSTLDALDAHGRHLRSTWEEITARDTGDVLTALLDALRRPDDVVRYRTLSRHAEASTLRPNSVRADLLAAVDAPTSPLLAQYLDGDPGGRPEGAVDVADPGVTETLVAPGRIARAAWPGDHLPHLSQQLALGAVLAADAPSLTVLDAPPGTGASTVLRELYANVLTDRAEAMAAFGEPSEAFGAVWGVWVGGVERRVRAPHPSLTGFEMVFASSNPVAVDDVVGEFSALARVGESWRGRTRCFRASASGYASEEDARFPRPGLLDDDVWGFAAAVLGDRIGGFAEIVGRHRAEDAPGTWLLKELGTRPGPLEWEQARTAFTAARTAVETRLVRMERWRVQAARVEVLSTRIPELDDEEAAARQRWERLAVEWSDAEISATRTGALTAATAALDEVARDRPDLRALWFDRSARQEWTHRREAAVAELARRQDEDGARRELAATVAARARHARHARQSAAHALAAAQDELAQLAADLVEMPPEPVDEHWWLRPETERERGTAWIDPELHVLRQELFVAAVRVHEIFARASYGIAVDNLRTFLAVVDDTITGADAARVAGPAWQSLFLVVPLVSTGLAGLGRLLRHVPPAALGWLIVGDAAHAAPAAAVGGLARFRRGLITGDRARPQPVRTLPAEVVDRLMDRHDVPRRYGPRWSSVQTLAESIGELGTRRATAWLGLPLRVHHRCLEPMFSLANRIAYSGSLIGVRAPRAGPGPLGPSRWIDVPRPDGARVHPGDWEHVLELLRCLDWNTRPSVAILSPFRAVATALAEQVRAHAAELGSAGLASAAQVRGAVTVGTLHTFAGRPRTAVILVLGGASPAARTWAATEPDLLGVAVTLATDDLYVIGDHARWSTLGDVAVLAEHVPVLETVG